MPAPVITASAPSSSLTPAAATVTENGLSPAQIEAELATVPEPQRRIAAMLPLSNLPPDWTVGKSGDRHLETFNADNLYEKIDGRAESFIQYGVKGMAYAFYHPTGDPSNELQLYIFEMGDSLKALGKYGSEKPDEFKAVAIGTEGYTSAGSTSFYCGTVLHADRLDPGRSQVRGLRAGIGRARCCPSRSREVRRRRHLRREHASPAEAAAVTAAVNRHHQTCTRTGGTWTPSRPLPSRQPPQPNRTPPRSPRRRSSRSCRPTAGKGTPSTSPRTSSATASSSDVFMADYKDGDVTWQGFLRPYRDAQEAKAMLEKYIAGVKKDGAEVKTLKAEGADEMVVSNNIGLVDVVFRKGNTLAGANGATSAPPAEAFARALAKSLPATVADARKQQLTLRVFDGDISFGSFVVRCYSLGSVAGFFFPNRGQRWAKN